MLPKSVGIIGGGESGVGTALLASKKGIEVFLSDYGNIEEAYKEELLKHKIPFEEKGHSLNKLKDFDIIVKSPGVPDKVDVIQKLNSMRKKIISEIEFGFYFADAPIIGITGSNGKTTTTGLIHHILDHAGVNSRVGGNIGKSFARILAEESDAPEVYVLELSSFQLDGIDRFRCDIALLLNITPDHLDRYDYNFENYMASKWQITQNQSEQDLLIYNGDDETIQTLISKDGQSQRRIAVNVEANKDTALSMEGVGKFEILNSALSGQHNRFNSMCAIYAANAFGVSAEDIQAGLDTFSNAPHRLELVTALNGISFINDSKATNVDAVFYALDAMKDPVIWIAGGVDKGNDYSVISELVKNKVKALICLGVDNEALVTAFEGKVTHLVECDSMEEAVKHSLRIGESGDVVLLSPACASFDLFDNYKHRGEEFRKEILKRKEN